jgi:hypothetical protein
VHNAHTWLPFIPIFPLQNYLLLWFGCGLSLRGSCAGDLVFRVAVTRMWNLHKVGLRTESDYVTGTEPLGVDWCWAVNLVPEKMGYIRRVKLAPLWLPISPWDLSLSYTLLTTILVTMLSCSQEALHRKQADGAVQSGTFSLLNCGLSKPLFFMHYPASGIWLQ